MGHRTSSKTHEDLISDPGDYTNIVLIINFQASTPATAVALRMQYLKNALIQFLQ